MRRKCVIEKVRFGWACDEERKGGGTAFGYDKWLFIQSYSLFLNP